MNWTWFLIGIAIALATLTALMHRAVGDDEKKERIGAGLCLLGGLVFLVVYQQDEEVVSLVLGLVCFVTGMQGLQLAGIRGRLSKLEQKVSFPGKAP